MITTAISPEFQNYLDELCQNNDISSVATEHGIAVKRSGNNYMCCCPFHTEKTPSCQLYLEDNHFHCFGCGAHGNVIKFLMQAENIDFMNAVEILSDRVGMTIPKRSGKNSGYKKRPAYSHSSASKTISHITSPPEPEPPPEYEQAPDIPEDIPPENIPPENIPPDRNEEYYFHSGGYSKKERIYQMNKAAGKFFHEQLFSPDGKAGLDYFKERGLKYETIKRFGLGFAADDYHKLHYYMKSLGYTDAELKEAALITTRDGKKYYDKFRNRVMFPVFDERGRVIAFGGRIITSDTKAPKYLNSDETPIFQKRKTLFALNYAKKSKADHFIICEGYMDVIAMHQAGFDSAVASLGTAVTSEQAELLSKRGKKKAVLSYDSDSAGQKATSRAIDLFMQTAFEKVTVLKISGAKDPDEFIKKYGGEAFSLLIDNSIGAVVFEMERLSNGLKMNDPDDKNVFIRRAVRFMADIHDDAFRELCAEKASILGDVSKKTVLDGVNELIQKKAPYLKKKQNDNAESRAEEEMYDSGLKGEENAETAVLSYLFHNPDEITKVEEQLSDGLLTDFGNGAYKTLVEKIRTSSGECEISWLSEKFPEEKGRINDIQNDTIYAFSEECFLEAAGKISDIKRKRTSVHNFADLANYIKYKQGDE